MELEYWHCWIHLSRAYWSWNICVGFTLNERSCMSKHTYLRSCPIFEFQSVLFYGVLTYQSNNYGIPKLRKDMFLNFCYVISKKMGVMILLSYLRTLLWHICMMYSRGFHEKGTKKAKSLCQEKDVAYFKKY